MQTTTDRILQKQIDAGIKGRRKGHSYEAVIADSLNNVRCPYRATIGFTKNIVSGKGEHILLSKIIAHLNWGKIDSVKAYHTGKLATLEDEKREIVVKGHSVSSSKSDVILELQHQSGEVRCIGVSIKQCNNKKPTNVQLFYTTARAFCDLLIENGIEISSSGIKAMRQFCGDPGFRPMDHSDCCNRISTPYRYFWEEIDSQGKIELEKIFLEKQNEITRLLLQKGYSDDPFPPEIILHKTKKVQGEEEFAIYTVDELVDLSRKYGSFGFNKYRVIKGSYKEPVGTEHLAPRFGVVQMQRGGQKKHPTQLQFNLKAGYFHALDKM